MKILIFVMVLVAICAVGLGGLPKLVQESEIKSCVAQFSAGNESEIVAMMDKSAYCRCLTVEAKAKGGMSGDVLVNCMNTHVQAHSDKYCTTTLTAQLREQNKKIDCGCFYQQTINQAQSAFDGKAASSPEQQQKETSAAIMEKCVTALPAE